MITVAFGVYIFGALRGSFNAAENSRGNSCGVGYGGLKSERVKNGCRRVAQFHITDFARNNGLTRCREHNVRFRLGYTAVSAAVNSAGLRGCSAVVGGYDKERFVKKPLFFVGIVDFAYVSVNGCNSFKMSCRAVAVSVSCLVYLVEMNEEERRIAGAYVIKRRVGNLSVGGCRLVGRVKVRHINAKSVLNHTVAYVWPSGNRSNVSVWHSLFNYAKEAWNVGVRWEAVCCHIYASVLVHTVKCVSISTAVNARLNTVEYRAPVLSRNRGDFSKRVVGYSAVLEDFINVRGRSIAEEVSRAVNTYNDYVLIA